MVIQNRLKNILNIARKNVPYYKYMSSIHERDCKLDDFPILNRSVLSQESFRFLNAEYSMYDVKYMVCQRTSGTSTGYPLNIYWKNEDYIRSSYYIWKYRKKWYDINPMDKYVCFHTYSYLRNRAEKSKDIIYGTNYISLNICDVTDDVLAYYCMIIDQYKPKWIQFIPHIALMLVNYMKKNDIEPVSTLKYIEYNGETLSDSIREQVDGFFNIQSANLYGSIETNAIAFECPHRNMVIISDNVYVESVGNKSYVTNLHNTVMPLIRYDLEDEVLITKKGCNCSKGDFVISKIFGRKTNEIQIGSYYVTEAKAGYCVDLINGNLCNCIQQFQFIKDVSAGSWMLLFYILPKFNGWKDAIISETNKIFNLHHISISKENILFTNREINVNGKKFSVFKQ